MGIYLVMQHSNSLGNGYAFINAPREYLHGKTLKWSWACAKWGAPTDFAQYAIIYDGEYDRSSDVDFPTPADGGWNPLLKGNGWLQTLASYDVSNAGPNYNTWVDVEVVADVDGGSEDMCCIMFRCQDGLADRDFGMAIDYFEIWDGEDLLASVTFEDESAFTMEKTASRGDYGYIGTGDFEEPPPPPPPLPDDAFGYNKGGFDMFVNKAIMIPRFTVSELPGVIFGGFIVDKYVCSQPRSAPSNGAPTIDHGNNPGGTAARSGPGVPVWDFIKLPQAMIACCNRGKGWHLMTPFEWSTLAWMSKKLNSMPRGGNANSDPPSDTDCPFEIAALDQDLHEVYPSDHRPLPGTGPNSWAHNGQPVGGVYDLQGLVWQWVMGFMTAEDCFLRYPANFEVSYLKSPYGRGTITSDEGTITLTCDGIGNNWLKNWTADEFNGANFSVYIAESEDGVGDLYLEITDTTPTTIVFESVGEVGGNPPDDGVATFVILKTGTDDIGSGMTSENKITSLITDITSDLARLAIPATSDASGLAEFGYDLFSFDDAAERGMCRGGSYEEGRGAGVFALSFSNDPVEYIRTIGFRAAKSL